MGAGYFPDPAQVKGMAPRLASAKLGRWYVL